MFSENTIYLAAIIFVSALLGYLYLKFIDTDANIEENCLINQSFIKDPDVKIGQLIQEAIAKLGENITINRFVRFALGEKS